MTDIAAKRDSAIWRGLAFIYETACQRENFQAYGSDYLCCFYCISGTSADPKLRRQARTFGRELARQWRRDHPNVPASADADEIADLVFGNDASQRLGIPDNRFKEQLRKKASSFSSRDLLFFDPITEPPPSDVPLECSCGAENCRGRKVCRRCGRRLEMMSSYWVWFTALVRSYTGERHGIKLGASCAEVLKWLPVMRPYPGHDTKGNWVDFYWASYAITHVVYVLNDYSSYRLSPAWLPEEYTFLKRSLMGTIKREDSELLGELVDTLRSFGLTDKHPLIREAVSFLLSSQNEDGSWGDSDAEDVFDRYHSTWTAIDGLRQYAWLGQRFSLHKLKFVLDYKNTNVGRLDEVANHASVSRKPFRRRR